MVNTELFFQIFNLNGQNAILDKLMLFGATDLIYITFAMVLILGIREGIREKKSFLLIILALPVAVLLIKIIHLFFYESRPFVTFNLLPYAPESQDASFPSRHATISAVIAFAYTYFKSKWTLLFLFIMLWIGVARIFVGVHYPLDVLGGFITAIISLMLALLVQKILNKFFLNS